MSKILSIDLGTNSLGYSVKNNHTNNLHPIERTGVRIFQKGVGEEKNNEFSLAAVRTEKRSARRKYARRRERKARLLRLLIANDMCPLPLDAWRQWAVYSKHRPRHYPQLPVFNNWLAINPYEARAKAVDPHATIALQELGRALYHIIQRRGYRSNRKDNQEKDGTVQSAINELNEQKGTQTLGQYFYSLNPHEKRIRNQYTSRLQYLEEFDAMMAAQKIADPLADQLRREIFFQRPLRSQKHTIGICTIEKQKSRCPVSHPAFEQFRMWSFINSIKCSETPDKQNMQPLTREQVARILPKFTRVSKDAFDFKDIADELNKAARKNNQQLFFNYDPRTKVMGCPTCAQLEHLLGSNWQTETIAYTKDDGSTGTIEAQDIWHALFSFEHDDKLKTWGQTRLGLDEEAATRFARIRLKQGYAALSYKAISKILPFLQQGLLYPHAVFCAQLPHILPPGVWNEREKAIIAAIGAILQADSEDKKTIAIVNGLVEQFRKNYANSDKNYELDASDLQDVEAAIINELGKRKWLQSGEAERAAWIASVSALYREQLRKHPPRGEFLQKQTLEEKIKTLLQQQYGASPQALEQLYHPSAIDTYPQAMRNPADGKRYLGSPRTASVRNPMAMRALHELRYLVNELIADGTIDDDTEVVIELSRELNDKNKRIAIQRWQRERDREHDSFRQEIIKLYKEQTGQDITPTDTDVLKYRLWMEQDHICLYTGEQIAITQFIGTPNAAVGRKWYDLEHTSPRSQSFDNSQANQTLANDYYNRSIKRNRLPTELPNYDKDAIIEGINYAAILPRIETWQQTIDELKQRIELCSYRAKVAGDKEAKDRAIQDRHYYRLHLEYWTTKYKHFTATEIKAGFKNSQITDTGVITRYARMYLKTVFDHVRVVKGTITAAFRKMWGLQDSYQAKERDNHVHHAIDAMVLCNIERGHYDALAAWYRDDDAKGRGAGQQPAPLPLPWPGFVRDVQAMADAILVSHGANDKMGKATKKKLRINGKLQYRKRQVQTAARTHWEYVLDEQGQRIPLYVQGDTARKPLHMDTFYGAIQRPVIDEKTGAVKTDAGGQPETGIFYVVRARLDELTEGDIKNIVDDTIRKLVSETGLKNAQEKGLFLPNKKNPDKPVPVKKLRLYARDVKDPLKIKKHSHLSAREWKHFYHAKNDSNYMMAIYSGKNEKGKPENAFELINAMDAARYYKESNAAERSALPLYPLRYIKNRGTARECVLPLKQTVRTGQMVLLYQHTPDEIDWNNVRDLHQRLYLVKGLSHSLIENKYDYGIIVLLFHTEARRIKDLKMQDGEFVPGDGKRYRKLNHNQFKALIQDADFTISPTGKIVPVNR